MAGQARHDMVMLEGSCRYGVEPGTISRAEGEVSNEAMLSLARSGRLSCMRAGCNRFGVEQSCRHPCVGVAAGQTTRDAEPDADE